MNPVALRLAVNAVNLAPGGGLTGLLGYLQAWHEMDVDLDLTVFASRGEVIDAVSASAPGLRIRPFGVGTSLPRRFALQQFVLGRTIEKSGARVVVSTNMLVARCRLPQIVHHQNLLLFDRDAFLTDLRWSPKLIPQKYYARKALEGSAFNVFISDFMRRRAEGIVPESVDRNSVIHNGLAERVIEAAARPLAWRGEPYIAAITSEEPYPHKPYKDNGTLIRCLAELASQRPEIPWRLGLASAGELREERSLAMELGVMNRIDWLGFVDPDGLDALLRRSLCLVFPSKKEGFGNPPLEAMARGCAVVAADSAALPEVIGRAGLLVEPGNSVAFAKAVEVLWAQPERRKNFVLAGFERIQHFRWKDGAERFYQLARELANKGSSEADAVPPDPEGSVSRETR